MSTTAPPVVDVVAAVVAILLADPGVDTVCCGNVFPYELPGNIMMPNKAVVVRFQGGPGGPATLQISESRVTIMAYGQTPALAHAVMNACYLALKHLQPSIWAHTYVHGCVLGSGEVALRNPDPDLQWPYSVTTWLVRTSDLTV